MKKHILVVDDYEPILKLFKSILPKNRFKVTTCSDSNDAIKKITEEEIDLVVTDLTLGEMDGLQILEYTHRNYKNIPFIVITGYGSIESAVHAVKIGAFEYIEKPFTREQMLRVIERALQESECLIDNNGNKKHFEEIIGHSVKMREVFRLIEKISGTTATILVQGESGTGKELVARAIHFLSLRNNGPFVPINCAVLSENLLENELFGHLRGAFTGATNYKKGLLEVANKGTLFLDEIGDMPAAVQTKLLRVIQEKKYLPLGGNEAVEVDVRFIAATNVNLQKAVREKRFREDLYYRLAVIPIYIPPLRERMEDVPLLAKHFVEKYSKENAKNIQGISLEAIEDLKKHQWAGNVRELENTIERAVALSSSEIITQDLLWGSLQQSFHENVQVSVPLQINSVTPLKAVLDEVTRKAIVNALKKTKGNRTQAATLLGMGRASLYHKLKEYGIDE